MRTTITNRSAWKSTARLYFNQRRLHRRAAIRAWDLWWNERARRFSCLCANIRSPHDITVAWHRHRAFPGKPEAAPGNTRQGRSYRASRCRQVRTGARAEEWTRVAGKPRREAPSLTCRARLSNEYAPSANFRPFPHAVIEVRQTPWVVEYNELPGAALRPQICWICMRPYAPSFHPPCSNYRYVRTRIRFRVGSSNLARSHFSQILLADTPGRLSSLLSRPSPFLFLSLPQSRTFFLSQSLQFAELWCCPYIQTGMDDVDQLPEKLWYVSWLDKINDANSVGCFEIIAHRRPSICNRV